jgi:uncharacterized protein (TIGR04255 family)
MQEELRDEPTPRLLPEFETPPVNEVVFGLLTRPVAGFAIPHIGRFWEQVKHDYPSSEEAPPLLPLIETFGDTPATMNVELTDVPLPRVWLVSESGNYLIQLQRDRFHYNWRRVNPQDTYPRYPAVRERFENALTRFMSFLDSSQIEPPTPLQYELTYINHIPISSEDTLGNELRRILRDFTWESVDRFLSEADQFNSSFSFRMPNDVGRLHTVCRLGQHRKTGERVLSLELVARGMPSSKKLPDMWSWFDVAHEWIVRGFTDLTEERIQQEEWRRTR